MAMDVEDSLVLMIDTNRYAGNFERELGVYITGIEPESANGITAMWLEKVATEREADEALDERMNAFSEIVDPYVASEYGDTYCEIAPTPGWTHDGHTDAHPNLNSPYPAFQTVAIYLTQEPSAEQVEYVKQRIEKFEVEYPKSKYGVPIQIFALRLVRKKTVFEEIPLAK